MSQAWDKEKIVDLVYGLVPHESLIAQWLEHPTSLRKVIGLIPVGDSDFFFVPHSRHVDFIFSQKVFYANKFSIFFFKSVLCKEMSKFCD